MRVDLRGRDRRVSQQFLHGAHILSMGQKNDLSAQAHRLFALLRAMPELPVIYARMPSKEGIGLAVFNRLIKAAGYTVIQL